MGNDFIAKSETQREKQHFFLNSTEVFGIQAVNLAYEQNSVPLTFLGMGKPVIVPNGVPKASFSVDTLVLGNDYFTSLTGNTGFNGFLVKSRDNVIENFSFSSGYLTAYNSRCSIGSIPAVSVQGEIYGNIGRLDNGESMEISGQFTSISTGNDVFSPMIAGPGSISLDIDDFSTNRVMSYDLTMSVNRNAIYPLGSRIPNNVKTNFPIEIQLTFQFAYNNYTPKALFSYPTAAIVKNLNITLNSFDSNLPIISYNLKDMFLIQESQSAGVQGQVLINAVYKGYVGSKDAALS